MVRAAIVALVTIALLSVFLVTRPIPSPATPNRGVRLEQVQLTLYPEQDPKARWEFSAAQVDQDPSTREAKVTGLQSGERYVEGRLDMRLFAPEVVIDRVDNLRLPYAKVEILKGCYTVNLGKPGEMPVTIDQREGFRAPSVYITAPSLEVQGKDFKSDFGIENPSWRDPIEKFISGGEQPPCPIEGGSS
ncbi:hypothetical protein [Meiothermus taiwanensis]|uniref:LPS export ABC transporter periplasmic protein LptC n=2 Tax=Meiothermus taiwanensis TaxID=172827 RepID=A0A399E2C4_9DEIN|nr:hypothetical protein [Meiothermus taiwanensis]AWR86537.1 hypothetical protein Mtai_v1c12950 [Meiothermus taiwanensis WR-220]KIQ55352.1 hypothetical protein SY28_03860 [Meiothermus taiwanensis]RIH76371.1 hypothetical protein Mcate_01786 [Meiothermus taiwanensis]